MEALELLTKQLSGYLFFTFAVSPQSYSQKWLNPSFWNSKNHSAALWQTSGMGNLSQHKWGKLWATKKGCCHGKYQATLLTGDTTSPAYNYGSVGCGSVVQTELSFVFKAEIQSLYSIWKIYFILPKWQHLLFEDRIYGAAFWEFTGKSLKSATPFIN